MVFYRDHQHTSQCRAPRNVASQRQHNRLGSQVTLYINCIKKTGWVQGVFILDVLETCRLALFRILHLLCKMLRKSPIWSIKLPRMCALVTNLQIVNYGSRSCQRFGHSVTANVSLLMWSTIFLQIAPKKVKPRTKKLEKTNFRGVIWLKKQFTTSAN
jgi:hypothetical protein